MSVLALLLLGCTSLLEQPLEADCEREVAWYPDENGDGIGDRTEVYVGCNPPEGWVYIGPDTAPPAHTGDTAAHTGDTAQPADTARHTGDTAQPADTARHTGDTAQPTDTARHTGDTAAHTGDTGP